jgi:hypothetical protein
MPQETETVRDFYEAVNRRDFEQAERYFHPEVEIYPGIGGELEEPSTPRAWPRPEELESTVRKPAG